MLPHFPGPVEIEPIDEADLAVVWLEDEHESFGGNLLYEDIFDVSWGEVAAVIREERALLEVASEATSAPEFDELADALVAERYSGERYTIDGDEIDEGPLTRFQEIDLGAMSAVAALVAAGAMTNTSCRGHQSWRGEPRPLVRFVCDGPVLRLVAGVAGQSGCGLLLDHLGNVQLYAADASAFVGFAERLLALSSELPDASPDGPLVSREGIEPYVELIESAPVLGYFSRRHLMWVEQMIASGKPMAGQEPLF